MIVSRGVRAGSRRGVFRVLALAAALWCALTGPAIPESLDEWDLDSFELDAFRFSARLKAIALGYDLSDVSIDEEAGSEYSGTGSLRLQFTGEPSRWFSYEVHLSTEASYFSHPSLAGLDASSENPDPLFRGLGKPAIWSESESHRFGGDVAYANARFTIKNSDLVVGRQAVTFGRSFFWNPIDWLSTFSPTEIDREFKAGIDAMRLSVPLGRFSGAEVVYAYGEDGERDSSALMGRVYVNLGGWDFEVLGGSVLVDDRYGLAFSGEIAGAGVRGEASWHEPRNGEEDFLRATLETDYRWPSSLVLMVELHYNGFGSRDVADYGELFRNERVTTGQIFNVGKEYTATQLSYEITPLMTVSGALLVNLHDGSGLFSPSVTRSLSDESDLVAGAFIAWGDSPNGLTIRSEYGTYPGTIWLQWRQSF